MRVVPQAFYKHPQIEKIMVSGLSSVIYKRVDQEDLQNQRYLSAHALTLVLNGGLKIESYEGDYKRIGKNQFVFLPKGMYMISDIIPDQQLFEAVVFFFDEDITDTFLNYHVSYPEWNGESLWTVSLNSDLRIFIDSLLSTHRGKEHHQFTGIKLLELLHLVALTKDGLNFLSVLSAAQKLEKSNIVKFMEMHFDKPLDIEDYAYLTGRSISTFHRDFKRRYGISPKKWLIERRLKKASELLRETNHSVGSIVREIGYENISHFIKSFHQKFGISPKQYQISHRREMEV